MSQIELNHKELSALEEVNIIPDTSFISVENLDALSVEDKKKVISRLEQTQAGPILLALLKQGSPDKTPVKIETQGKIEKLRSEDIGSLGVFDDATYVYGVLLRHGVMPDKAIGFFQADPKDPIWKQAIMKGLHYALHKMPVVKHIDMPADIGRATYVYPMKLRNAIVNSLGKMKKDEFDAMLMALSGEKDYHQRLLGALTEIHNGLQSDRTKKEVVDWISITQAQKEKLNQMMELIKTGNPDPKELSNHMIEYSGIRNLENSRGFQFILQIHGEQDPIKKKALIDSGKKKLDLEYKRNLESTHLSVEEKAGVNKRISEMYSVLANLENGHYQNRQHLEGGAGRFAKASGNMNDPQMKELSGVLSKENTPGNIQEKKSKIQAELNSPELKKLAELEKRGVLIEFQRAASAVEGLSKGAEDAIDKLKAGNTQESIKAGEDYLKNLGESIQGTNEKIGTINDKALTHWTSLPKVDQDALLKASVGTTSFAYISRLASHEAAMKGLAEKAGKINHSKPMRFMYGLIGIVAAGAISFEYFGGNKETAKNDLKDVAYGFVPGYDLYRAWDGTDLNGRPLKGWDRFERAAWGTLTLGGAIVTLGTSSLIIGGLRAGVKGVKAANTLSNIVKVGSAGMGVASVSHFGYNIVTLNGRQVGPNGEKIVKIQ